MSFLPKVAIQGEKGSFSEEAGTKYWGKSVEFIPKNTFDQVINAVDEKKVDFGLLPLENTLIGSITTTYDLLLEYDLPIVGEIITTVSHYLLAPKKVPVNEIRKIYSHPAALSQCSSFLQSLHNCEVVPLYDTAGSAMKVSKEKDPHSAAIASRLAARIYNLEMVAEKLEDYPNNQTRFIIISCSKEEVYHKKAKTSIIFTTLNQPGALYRVLKIFNDYGINLTKLESRPHKTEPWRFYFYLDFEGALQDKMVKEAMAELKQETNFLKILGSYPVWTGSRNIEHIKKMEEKEDKSHLPLYSRERKPEPTCITLEHPGIEPCTIGGD
ncbi:MAG: prephenate dehydratase, partial [Spirochaetota bacterium]